ncbi:MAG TPA: glycosyltransferase family 2 protein [Candidatus Nanopelagicales bacterium]
MIDVLIPTIDRVGALAVTLAGLAAQADGVLAGVTIADQSERPVAEEPLVVAMLRTLEHHGVPVAVHRRPVRRGVAEQRDYLLRQAQAELVLFLDDDVWLEPWAAATMASALHQHGCGFVGMAVTGLSHLADRRPHEVVPFEPWDGPVQPEDVRPESEAWARYQLHNAANPTHLAEQVGATPGAPVAYRVAWVGGCVLYRRRALEAVGGFSFWPSLPVPHSGEDVLVQLRVMRRFGGAGLLPSGAVHLELPTTIPHRPVDAWMLDAAAAGGGRG